MKDAGQESATLKNKLSSLAQQYQQSQKNVEALTRAYNESQARTDALSQETQDLTKRLNDAEGEVRELKSALDQYTNSTTDAATQTKRNTDDMGSSWNGFGVTVLGVVVGIVTAAASAVTSLTKMGLQFNTEIEGYTTNFEVLLGNAELAAEKVDQLKEMAAKTPFGIGDLTQATQTLLGFGIEAEKTDGILTMLGDAALGDKNKLQALALSFAQATSAGRLMGQDLMQMINAGFNPLNSLAEQTGLSVGQLKEVMSGTSEEARATMLAMEGVTDYGRQIIEQGYISADDLYNALQAATSEGGLFFQGMEKSSQTLSGLISTLTDDFNSILGTAANPLFNWLKSDVLPGAGNLVQALGDLLSGEGSADAVAEIGTNLLVGIMKGIGNGAESLAGTLVSTIDAVVSKIPIDRLASAGGTLMGKLVNAFASISRGFSTIAAQLIPVIIPAIPVFLDALFSSADFEMAIMSFLANTDVFAQIVPTLVEVMLSTLPDVIAVVMDGLSKAYPQIASAAFDVAWGVISGIGKAIGQVVIDIIPALVNSIINAVFGAGETALGYLSVMATKFGFTGAAEKFDSARDWLNSNAPNLSWESGFTIPTETVEPTEHKSTTIGDVSVNVNVPNTNASPEEIGDAVAEAINIALGEITGRRAATYGASRIMAR